jgi:hypothetical protein
MIPAAYGFKVSPGGDFAQGEVGAWADVSMDVYQRSEGHSNSQLRMLAESPMRYRLTMDGKLPRHTPTKDMILGTAIHSIVGEGKNIGYHLRPDFYGPEKKPWNNNANECKAWYDKHRDKPVLKSDDVALLQVIEHCAKSDARAMKLMKGAIAELTAVARNGNLEAPFLLRCRPDLFGHDGDGYYFIEVKSTRDAKTASLQREILSREYHVQIALYHRVLCKLTGAAVTPYIFAIEKTADLPRTNLRRVSHLWLEAGSRILDSRLDLLSRCSLANSWPALPDFEPGDRVPVIDVPDWMVADVENLEGLTEAEDAAA